MVRFVVFRFGPVGVYLHKICRSDHDRALHDHPWPYCTMILRRGYYEVTERGRFWRGVGRVLFRPARWRHRLVITGKPAWTLFLVGPRQRRWGFWVNGTDWCWWRKYNSDLAICEDRILHTTGED